MLDPKRVIQIGIRGTAYNSEDRDFAHSVGVRVIPVDEFFKRGIPDVIEEVKDVLGTHPSYLSYDIDFIDPAFAPGTGTPEAGGFTGYDGIELVRGLTEIDFIGYDMVEVMPPYDPGDITSLLAANIMYEFISLIALSKKDTKETN